MNNMKVKCTSDYFGDPVSKFFIWKKEIKQLPEKLSPELEQAMDQGLLIETTEDESNIKKPVKQIIKDEVNKAQTLKE